MVRIQIFALNAGWRMKNFGNVGTNPFMGPINKAYDIINERSLREWSFITREGGLGNFDPRSGKNFNHPSRGLRKSSTPPSHGPNKVQFVLKRCPAFEQEKTAIPPLGMECQLGIITLCFSQCGI